MIFISVGTHPQPFDRLLEKIDELIENGKIKEEVVAQTGVSGYKPKYFKCKSFFDFSELEKLMKKSSLVITHAGAGSIIDALNFGKPVVVVPRLKKFSEHTNDHQLELARALEKKEKVIAVYDIENLESAVNRARKLKIVKVEKSVLAEKLYTYLKSAQVKK